jgi:hypothetical protein
VTIAEVANRGLNLLATALLVLGGLTFGSILFQEVDPSDKVDDGGFLLIAAVALGWYLFRRNRFAHSTVPLWIAVAAVAVQILGLVLERDDPKAFGDNIGGAVYFGATLVLLVVQFLAASPNAATKESR